MQQPLVSFLIIARNAENTLSGLLRDLSAQDYPKNRIELLFCDSVSSDGTKALFSAFMEENRQSYSRILLLDNPKRTLPCGWNVCLSASRGELIIRVDAHSSLPADFIAQNVRLYQAGHLVVGGPRTSIADHPDAWQHTLLGVEESMFGSGIAGYRHEEKQGHEVKTVAHGAYARQVFETVGGYDERLTRTEDNEMHCRLRKAGFTIWSDPAVQSKHRVRNSYKKMLRQKYANGHWIGLTLSVSPDCISLYHLVPGCFVLALLVSIVLLFFGIVLPFVICFLPYLLLNGLMSFLTWRSKPFIPWRYCHILPALFFGLHMAYGLGTLFGLIQLPFWRFRKENRSCPAIRRVGEAMKENDRKAEEEA